MLASLEDIEVKAGNILIVATPSKARVEIIVSVDLPFITNKTATNKIETTPKISKSKRGKLSTILEKKVLLSTPFVSFLNAFTKNSSRAKIFVSLIAPNT